MELVPPARYTRSTAETEAVAAFEQARRKRPRNSEVSGSSPVILAQHLGQNVIQIGPGTTDKGLGGSQVGLLVKLG